MEIGRWEYTGISWDFGPGGSPRGEGLRKSPRGAVGSEGAGCPGKEQSPSTTGKASTVCLDKLLLF